MAPAGFRSREAIVEFLTKSTASSARSDAPGKHILVTAGPTHEPIDPVRVIANRSSGRQGFAIASAAAEAGARVTLSPDRSPCETPRRR